MSTSQREDGTDERAEDGVGCEGGGGVDCEGVDEVELDWHLEGWISFGRVMVGGRVAYECCEEANSDCIVLVGLMGLKWWILLTKACADDWYDPMDMLVC